MVNIQSNSQDDMSAGLTESLMTMILLLKLYQKLGTIIIFSIIYG